MLWRRVVWGESQHTRWFFSLYPLVQRCSSFYIQTIVQTDRHGEANVHWNHVRIMPEWTDCDYVTHINSHVVEGIKYLRPAQHWEREFESHSRRGCIFCVPSMLLLFCVGSGLVKTWSSYQGIPLTVCKFNIFCIWRDQRVYCVNERSYPPPKNNLEFILLRRSLIAP